MTKLCWSIIDGDIRKHIVELVNCLQSLGTVEDLDEYLTLTLLFSDQIRSAIKEWEKDQ